MAQFYTEPKNRLPRATGMGDSEYKFGKRTKKQLLAWPHVSISKFWRDAISNPGVIQVLYWEENGYEYERRATYHEETNTMISNDYCPFYYNHHVGNTCGCCGQKD